MQRMNFEELDMSTKTKNNTLISWFFTGLSFFSTGAASADNTPDPVKQTTNITSVRYNDTCNGSLAWVSSTTETRGASNSAATISSNKLYYGINQLDGYNVSRLITFINTNDKYQKLRGHLSCSRQRVKNKNGKTVLKYVVDGAKWKKLAQTQNALFTAAQEDFLCEVYLPECFKKLQKSLIAEAQRKHTAPIAVSNLHPAVLSLFARRYVKAPNSKAPFEAIKNKKLTQINNEKFIKDFCGSNEYLKEKALSAFNRKDFHWKEYQILKACSLAQQEYEQYQMKHQTHLAMASQDTIENRINACREHEGLIAAAPDTTANSKTISPQFSSIARNRQQRG